jgi:hypothetical protein
MVADIMRHHAGLDVERNDRTPLGNGRSVIGPTVTLDLPAWCSGSSAIFTAILRASPLLIDLSRQHRNSSDDGLLVHTNTPSVPNHMETNDTGLGATSKGDNHNGA